MISIRGGEARLCDGITRRDFMRVGALGTLGLGLPQLLQAEAHAAEIAKAAGKSTGVPVLYNTSFNLFGDPLVCSPRDAVRSFYSSGIDAMFVGQFQLQK